MHPDRVVLQREAKFDGGWLTDFAYLLMFVIAGTIFEATGLNFADALTAGPAAALGLTISNAMQLLADGMSNADVAARLFISQETVKSHVRHILSKLEADTRTHAVAIALRQAIID